MSQQWDTGGGRSSDRALFWLFEKMGRSMTGGRSSERALFWVFEKMGRSMTGRRSSERALFWVFWPGVIKQIIKQKNNLRSLAIRYGKSNVQVLVRVVRRHRVRITGSDVFSVSPEML